MTWYNTTKEPNKSELDQMAQSQEEKILDWFIEHPHIEATPFNIQQWCLPSSPITSVRRAMSDLTRDGNLEKTDRKAMEKYGMRNYQWKLKERLLKLF